MSLILEALRKSEAERRRGQTPDLLTDAIPVAATARRAPPNWTVLLPVIGAALITLLLVVWWLRPAAEPVSNRDAVREASADDRAVDEPAVLRPPNTASVQSQPSLSPPVIRSPAPASAPTTSTPSAAAPSAATAAPPTTATTREPAPASAPVAAAPKPALPTPAQVASLEPPPAPASTNPPAFASPDAPVKLADLSSEDRAQLPTLKVSMHMWSPDAGSRFAIIDGTRVNEGDRVGEATIEVIQQDSVMLSWRGRQIRLPIR
jgi:general secretion pathway protein B